MSELHSIPEAIEAIRQGEIIIVVDDEDRENEGDFLIAARHATPEVVNFMATHGRGLICLALTRQRVEALGLELMSRKNRTRHETAFTVAIEAREGVTTGISAADRARTVSVAIDAGKGADDIVTPGHVYYCAGGTFEGQFVPLLDILRDDGIVQHEDGRLIRAATGCEVGSDDDRQFWAFLVSEEADGTERVRGKCQLRFGSRFMLPDGRHFSMRDYLDGIGVEIIESGPYEVYARFRKTGLISVFPWTLSDRLPQPEDFILQRSGTTLSDIYRASEWEATHPRMAAPVALESGPVQPLSSCEHAASPRNMPLALAGHGASSTLQLNRKARKAAAAKERREGRSRKRLH